MHQNDAFQDPHVAVSAPATQSEAGGLAGVRERIAAIDAAAADYLRGQRPANTRRSYAGDWQVWCRYCAAVGVSSGDVSPGLLVGLAVWLEGGQHRTDGTPAAPSTIRRRIYGTITALRERGVAVPAEATRAANDAVNAYERRLAATGQRRGRGPAPAATVKHLRAICAELPDTLAGARDRAILLLGFAIAARRDELAHLSMTDIGDDEHGLMVHVRYSKTAERTVAVPYGTRHATCPVRAWHAWREAAGLTGGWAFRRINRHGWLGPSITAAGIGRAITHAADTAGLTVRFTGHSLRSGLATEARRAGHDPHSIATQGGWTGDSAVLHGYLHIVDRWDDNALTDIGL